VGHKIHLLQLVVLAAVVAVAIATHQPQAQQVEMAEDATKAAALRQAVLVVHFAMQVVAVLVAWLRQPVTQSLEVSVCR
jgi:hypothetical protein